MLKQRWKEIWIVEKFPLFNTVTSVRTKLITLILRIGGNLRKYRFRQQFFVSVINPFAEYHIGTLYIWPCFLLLAPRIITQPPCTIASIKVASAKTILKYCYGVQWNFAKTNVAQNLFGIEPSMRLRKSWIANVKDFITISNFNLVTHIWFSKLR